MLLISNFKKPSIWQPHTDFLFSKIMSVMAESWCFTTQSSSGASRYSANKTVTLTPSFTRGHQWAGKGGITKRENNLGTRAVAQVMVKSQDEKPVVAKQQQSQRRDSLQLRSSGNKLTFTESQHTLVTRMGYLQLPWLKSLKDQQSRK